MVLSPRLTVVSTDWLVLKRPKKSLSCVSLVFVSLLPVLCVSSNLSLLSRKPFLVVSSCLVVAPLFFVFSKVAVREPSLFRVAALPLPLASLLMSEVLPLLNLSLFFSASAAAFRAASAAAA